MNILQRLREFVGAFRSVFRRKRTTIKEVKLRIDEAEFDAPPWLKPARNIKPLMDVSGVLSFPEFPRPAKPIHNADVEKSTEDIERKPRKKKSRHQKWFEAGIPRTLPNTKRKKRRRLQSAGRRNSRPNPK